MTHELPPDAETMEPVEGESEPLAGAAGFAYDPSAGGDKNTFE
jgi:hypothetical protein